MNKNSNLSSRRNNVLTSMTATTRTIRDPPLHHHHHHHAVCQVSAEAQRSKLLDILDSVLALIDIDDFSSPPQVIRSHSNHKKKTDRQ
jgi:hypothetical protein